MADYVNETNALNRCRSVLGMPSTRHVCFVFLWIFFIVAFIILAFTVFGKRSNCCPQREINPSSFEYIRKSVNMSVDPCVDFYNFACGLWSTSDLLDTTFSRMDSFSLLQIEINKNKEFLLQGTNIGEDLPFLVNNAVTFYKYCTETVASNETGPQLLLEHINKFGGLPLLNKNIWNETSFNVLGSSAYISRNFDVDTIIGLNMMYDPFNSSRTVLHLKPPTYVREPSMDNMLSLEILYNTVKVLNNSFLHPDCYDDLYKLVQIQQKWKKALAYKQSSNRQLMTVGVLLKSLPEFNWLEYLQLATNDTLSGLNKISLNDTVIIDNLSYFVKLVDVINSGMFSNKELADLFGWILLKDIWVLIPGVLDSYSKHLQYGYNDTLQVAQRQCFKFVTESFSTALDYLYVKNVSHSSIFIANVLFDNIKKSFHDVISACTWLDSDAKYSVLRKLNYMQYINGFPNYLNNVTALNIMYKEFPVVSRNILESYFNIQRFYFRLRVLQLKSTVECYELPRSIMDIGAYNIVQKNTLVFPISLYQPPFLYADGPWYLNFGAIGSVIGHEIMHGLDLTGNDSDEYGNLRDWLSNSTLISYEDHLNCFEDQYSTLDSTGTFFNNGSDTLVENIADNVGLFVAYTAFKKYEEIFKVEYRETTFDDFTSDQSFFLAFGSMWCSKYSAHMEYLFRDKHSLPELRVNKAVSNMKSFSSAFSCPKGSPMNPEAKCSLW